MMNRKHLCVGARLRAVLGVLLLLVALGALLQAKDKGDKDYKEAQAAAARLDWDKALPLYMSALDKNPNNMDYKIGMQRARFQDGQMHVNRGQKLRTEGKIEEAMGEFQKALIADPSSGIAIQELKRTQAMIDASKGKPVDPSLVGLTPAEKERRSSDRRVSSIEAPPVLTPVVSRIPPIKMNNQPPKVLYETIGKMAGINVVFDSQYTAPQRNSNVDIATNTPIEEAFDYLAMLTHTFWKPISPNTIFVAEDNVTKRRDYEDEVVKVFYVTNVTSTQEFQEIATTIRTVAEIRRVFTFNAQKALIVRGTADQVALTEKLIHDLDKPKSEVVIDVDVLQVNDQYSRSLAATIASGGTAGLSQTISYNGPNSVASTAASGTGTTPATGTGTATLSQIAHTSINQFSTSLPGALLNAVMSDSRTKTLNKPQVRASDGMKVELIIGQRIPYATGSFSSGVSVSSSVSPLVSTQFNYADVGTKLTITPQIHSASECTLHVEVEVSAVQQYVSIGGISQPVIQQTKNTADIRLRDGEVNLLSGLSQNSDASTLGGIPGLTSIPILGQFLFGASTKNKQSGELMIALTPHIIRTPDYTAENLRGIYAGSDQVVKLYYTPKGDEPGAPGNPPQPEAASHAGTAASPAVVAPVAVAPAAAPQVVPGTPQVGAPGSVPPGVLPAGVVPGQAGAPQLIHRPPVPDAPPSQAAVAPKTLVKFAPGSVQLKPGETVQVELLINNAPDLFSATSIRVKYDAALLKLNDATPGELFTREGVRPTSVKDIRNEVGEATLAVSRTPGSKGVSGPGTVMVLNFTAVGKGTGTVTLPELELKNSQLQPVVVTPSELSVKVN
jgi:general secretion pathway protein D